MTPRSWTVLLLALVAVAGCRGKISESPPIHVNPNMDDQEKIDPQEVGPLLADGRPLFPDLRAARQPVPGTIARGALRTDTIYYQGTFPNGDYTQYSPVETTAELLERGRERFNIVCAVCHDRTGAGKGMVTHYIGMTPPTNLLEDAISKDMTDGQIFNTITNGARNMPSYKHQIPVEDRWAVIAYLRALQRSQSTTIEDVPPDIRPTLVTNK